jgi:hypothetical protein
MGLNDLSSCITNINLIKNTNKISIINKIFLVILFITHWIFMGGVATYFIWGSPDYDKILIFSLILLILTWTIIYKECMTSYYEKNIISEIIDTDNMRNPSLDLYCYNNNVTLYIEILINILMTFNFAFAMLRMEIPKFLVLIFIICMISNNLYFRFLDLLKNYKLV